jgi:amidohydrolase
MVKIAKEAAQEVFAGEKNIIDNQTIASEDFSEFSAKVPGVFMFLGSGNEKKGTHVSHHNPCFKIDEDTLPDGVAMYVKGTLNFFKHAKNLKFLGRKRR